MTALPDHIVTEWDAEAGVYMVTSKTIPGLVCEAETLDEVVRKVALIIPALSEHATNGSVKP